MSVEAMVMCWGPGFPNVTPSARLVALAIADGVHPDDGNDELVNSPAVIDCLVHKTGLDRDELWAALTELISTDVLIDYGSSWRWNFEALR